MLIAALYIYKLIYPVYVIPLALAIAIGLIRILFLPFPRAIR